MLLFRLISVILLSEKEAGLKSQYKKFEEAISMSNKFELLLHQFRTHNVNLFSGDIHSSSDLINGRLEHSGAEMPTKIFNRMLRIEIIVVNFLSISLCY